MTATTAMSAAERAYEVIRGGILDGTFPLGARLPEEDLAARAGVSRTPVREALRQLAAEGFVTFAPNRGAQVASWSDDDLDEIFQLRALLESHAAARAARRMDASRLLALHELADGMDEAARRGTPAALDRIAALNNRFHRTILAAADSQRLHAMLDTVIVVPVVHRTFHHYTPAALSRSMHHHRELLAAFEAGDGDWAGTVMRTHVLAARAVLLGDRRDTPQDER
jgi:DNA-binding GntR family transcriptional regulator